MTHKQLQAMFDELQHPRRMQAIADAFAEGYRRAHPELDENAFSASEVEAATVDFFRNQFEHKNRVNFRRALPDENIEEPDE